MQGYILNDDVLYFSSDKNGIGTFITEKGRKLYLKISCIKLLKYSCNFYGNSYNIQRQFVIDVFNYYIKTPIITSSFNMIIFFPTSSPSSDKCVWIAYNNVTRYVKENNRTKIYFDNGNVLSLNVPYVTIDNQITKCIKIEKYLNSIMRKTVEK